MVTSAVDIEVLRLFLSTTSFSSLLPMFKRTVTDTRRFCFDLENCDVWFVRELYDAEIQGVLTLGRKILLLFFCRHVADHCAEVLPGRIKG